MIDPDEISWFNKLMYVIYAFAIVVICMDILVWRPN